MIEQKSSSLSGDPVLARVNSRERDAAENGFIDTSQSDSEDGYKTPNGPLSDTFAHGFSEQFEAAIRRLSGQLM